MVLLLEGHKHMNATDSAIVTFQPKVANKCNECSCFTKACSLSMMLKGPWSLSMAKAEYSVHLADTRVVISMFPWPVC